VPARFVSDGFGCLSTFTRCFWNENPELWTLVSCFWDLVSSFRNENSGFRNLVWEASDENPGLPILVSGLRTLISGLPIFVAGSPFFVLGFRILFPKIPLLPSPRVSVTPNKNSGVALSRQSKLALEIEMIPTEFRGAFNVHLVNWEAMKFRPSCGALAALSLLGTLATAHARRADPSYRVAATYKLAGDGGWDYLTLDSLSHRLYIARGKIIQVMDTQTGTLVGEVPGLDGAHGVALDSDAHRAYASSGKNNQVIVFDTQTLKAIGDPISVGDKPDAILFEPITKRVFAFDAGSNEVSIIDTATNKVVATTPLGGNPEFGAPDGAGHMWVNIEDKSEIVEINAADGKLMGTYPLAPGEEPTGLAYDAKGARLFSGCANKTMVVIDAKTGKQIKVLPIGEGVDATAFDATRNVAFSANGRDGTLSVIGLNDRGLNVLNTVPTHIGARTMALDSATGDIYVVAADYLPSEAPVEGQRPHHPKIVPGSVIVLKLSPVSTP